MRKTVHYKISGLSYVFLKDAPVVHTRFGDALAVDLSLVERKIAREIVKQGVPLRGAEVQFLRKCLGFSMEKFATRLGLSAPAILKWERARKKRLEPVNEVAVRALMVEELGIKLDGKFSSLIGLEVAPKKVFLKVA